LLVHGPLIATLLAELLRQKNPNFTPTSLNVRAMSPLFDNAPFSVCGEPQSDGGALLWARNASGGLAMEVRAQ
jgi:3-methylfumaryl-CoA hydratase